MQTKAKLTGALAAVLFILAVAVQAFPMSVGEEKKLGRELAITFIDNLPMLEDPEINRYIRELGQHIVDSNQPQLFEYHFYVVKNPSINAFALPGGYIFVHTGLILSADSEAELVGVLSHEIGHVTNRHISRRIDKMNKMNLTALAALIAGAFLAEDAEQFAAIASAGMAMQSSAALAYSRQDEEEADRTAVRYMRRAGFKPEAMVSFMDKIASISPDMYPAYLSTHPPPKERRTYISGLQNPLGMDVGRLERTPGRFRKIQVRLIATEKDVEDAVNAFNDMLFADPEDVDAIYGKALVYEKDRQDEKAEELFLKAMGLVPGESTYYRDYGVFLLKRGRMPQAIDNLLKANRLNDDDPTTLLYLGLAYKETGQFDRAADFFERGMNADPEELNFIYHLGQSRGASGDECAGYYYLGLYYERRGNKRLALQNYKRALTACSNNPQFLKLVQDRLE